MQELAKSLRVIEPPEERPTVASSKNKLPERQPSQDAPSPPSPQVARSVSGRQSSRVTKVPLAKLHRVFKFMESLSVMERNRKKR